MSTLTSYNQLQVVTPGPSGTGGLAINNNFKMLSTKLATSDPGPTDDSSANYAPGSIWYNTNSKTAFICIVATVGAAQWNTLPTAISSTNQATSGTIVGLAITPIYDQTSGTAANTDLLINRTETAIGSGSQRLIDAKVGGTSKFYVDHLGNQFVNGLADAGSGTITIGTATVLSGNSWSIDSSGNGAFFSMSLPSGSFNYDYSDANFASQVSTQINNYNYWTTDTNWVSAVEYMLTNNYYGSFYTLSVGDGAAATIDGSGNGTFANLTARSLSIASAAIDNSGDATFANLQSSSQTLPTINSTVSGATAGQVGYDPGTNKAYVWDGSVWNALW